MTHQVIPLASIVKKGQTQSAPSGCGAKGKSACGSGSGAGDLAPEVWEKVKDHPCYSEEAHHYFARMHVAVAPACNIQCNYCNRKYDCANESRPGVVSEKLTPEQAAVKVRAVAARLPQLSVIGIAGPGDALANPDKTFRTFDLVREALPDARLCLSTNGLALIDHVERIKEYGVDHVTITLNALDPAIGAEIYPWIFFDHRRRTGREAAEILAERQLAGLDSLVAAGILVKVNSVMIPGINDGHLLEVNREVKRRGAFLHNIMPLISDPAHGTAFGLSGRRGPTPQELMALQDSCDGGAKLMRHCRQCRADAVGLLGEDCGTDFALDKIEDAPKPDAEARALYREVVERERADKKAAEDIARARLSGKGEAVLVAVASKGGGRVNQHFGHAREFLIYEIDGEGARFKGHRKVENYCQGGWGEEDNLGPILEALKDCRAVLVAKIGRCPKADLAKAGLAAIEIEDQGYIEPALIAYYAERRGEERRPLLA